MPDLQRVLVDTEDFLIRQLGSRAAREASKRRLRRGVGEAMRRVRRAALIFVLLLLALIGWSVAGNEVGFFIWLIALPAMLLAALVSLMWPTRAGRADEPTVPPAEAVARMPLEALADRCEQWLLDRCRDLPRAALPAAELILARLQALRPHLADLPAGAPAAGEARRLIGGHLPRLVDSYLALPPEARDPRSENSRRIAESLDLVADELARLCGDLDGCRAADFETEHRFIEMRYREDDGLKRE